MNLIRKILLYIKNLKEAKLEKLKLFKINNDILIKYDFLEINKKDSSFLLNYIEKLARELAEKEDVKVFNVTFDEMNKDEILESNKAVGVFKSLKGVNKEEYYKKVKSHIYKWNITDEKELRTISYPRIELSEKSDTFVLIHELGHYFLYKRNQPQSESAANLYVKEFFDTYLPPFFSWIYQIDIAIRIKKEKQEYTNLECYNFLQEYKKFKKEQQC